MLFCHFFMTSTAHFFYAKIPFLCPDCIFLTACMRVFPVLFHIFANNLMSSMYIRWLIFSCDLLSLYPVAHFLSMWFSGIMAIMNSKDDSASPWKMPLWIFVSAMLLPLAVSSTLQVFMVCSMKFMTSWDILYILRQCSIQLCGTISYAYFVVNPGHSKVFPPCLALI